MKTRDQIENWTEDVGNISWKEKLELRIDVQPHS